MDKDFKNNKNFLEKKEFLKSRIFDALRIDKDIKICKMLRHIWAVGGLGFNIYRVTKLSEEEIIVAQILKECKISPRTGYRWFTLSRAPKETLENCLTQNISMNKFRKMWKGLKGRNIDEEKEKLGKELISDICSVVGGM